MSIKAVKGTKDILPADSGIWRWIEQKAQAQCAIYGYQKIATPILEDARLFTRSIGPGSDIVRKEMYSFSDRKQRLLALRPEATASVVRAYLEHGLGNTAALVKFYYFGPMFRAERPQAGRLRQFHHIGVEAIGSNSPYLDAEVISLSINIIRQLEISGYTLKLNSLGCRRDRQKYIPKLKKELKLKLKLLCADCRTRYKINPLRVFDCKNPTCKSTIRLLPAVQQYFCPDCKQHYAQVQSALDDLKIKYTLSAHLVRGLDYYTKTCFEISHPQLGAQDALGAGGRYDDLVTELGGAPKPAIGFALGVERLMAVLEPKKLKLTALKPCVYLAVIGEQQKQMAFKLLHKLRQAGLAAEMNYLDKSLKGQMRQADKLGARFVAILGEEEVKRQSVMLRDMQNKSQTQVKISQLIAQLKG